MRGRKGLNLDYAALYQRYLAGESTADIAKSIGIDQSGLNRSWQRRGYTLRSVSEARLLQHRQRPEMRASILIAQEARRGTTDSLATKVARAQTREAHLIGASPNERILAAELAKRGIATRAQVAIGPYNADLLVDAARLVIEVDGGGHSERNRAMRAKRTAYIEAQGYRVLHVWAKNRSPGWLGRALEKVSGHL